MNTANDELLNLSPADIGKLSTLDMTQYFKDAGRRIQDLRQKLASAHMAQSADELTAIAGAQDVIDKLGSQRKLLGTMIIKDDQARKKRHQEGLVKKRATAHTLYDDLMDELPDFAAELKDELELLGARYASILDKAESIRQINNHTMANRQGAAISSACIMDPNALNKIVAGEIARCFGYDVACTHVDNPKMCHLQGQTAVTQVEVIKSSCCKT